MECSKTGGIRRKPEGDDRVPPGERQTEDQQREAASTGNGNPGSDRRRRLVVVADDFGRSSAVNHAVIRAHREGVLTCASLMVNGPACSEAVRLAQEYPSLAVGLHLALVCGRSALKPTEIPGLVDEQYHFSRFPIVAGLRYFFRAGLRWQLRHEIHAQFQKFRMTGLKLDHVNGHLHLHLHPTILSLLRRHREEWGVTHLRLTRDPFWFNCRLSGGHWCYRLLHGAVFTWLAGQARPRLRRSGIRHVDRVFGLLQNGRVNERYLTRLLERLPDGDQELYTHPSTEGAGSRELEALVSPNVRRICRDRGIELVRYQDL